MWLLSSIPIYHGSLQIHHVPPQIHHVLKSDFPASLPNLFLFVSVINAEAQNLSGIQYSVIYHGHAREKLVLLGDTYG